MADVFLFWCAAGRGRLPLRRRLHDPRCAVWQYIVGQGARRVPGHDLPARGPGRQASRHHGALLTDARPRLGLLGAVPELRPRPDRALPARLHRDLPPPTGSGPLRRDPRQQPAGRRVARLRPLAHRPLRPARPDGAFGITNGVEWFATEKIDVHEARPSTGAPGQPGGRDRPAHAPPPLPPRVSRPDECALVERATGTRSWSCAPSPTDRRLLVLVNLDPDPGTAAAWNPAVRRPAPACTTCSRRPRSRSTPPAGYTCALAPGQALCLTAEPADLTRRPRAPAAPARCRPASSASARAPWPWRCSPPPRLAGHRDADPDRAADALGGRPCRLLRRA